MSGDKTISGDPQILNHLGRSNDTICLSDLRLLGELVHESQASHPARSQHNHSSDWSA